MYPRLSVHCCSAPCSVQTYSSPDCADGTGTTNPFAPPLSHGDGDGTAHPQSATIAFGVCFKDLRVDNINDDPDTAFNEHLVYNYLPKYVKMVCNADGTVTKLTYNDKTCTGPEVDDQTVLRALLDAMLTAEDPGASLSNLPSSAVHIMAPSNNLVAGTCYEDFSLDYSSLTTKANAVLSMSTKYTALGQYTKHSPPHSVYHGWLYNFLVVAGHCEPAIAGAGTITSTDYATEDCSDDAAPGKAGDGNGGTDTGAVSVHAISSTAAVLDCYPGTFLRD